MKTENPLSAGVLQPLAGLSTPTGYNGWEQITKHDPLGGFVNFEPAKVFHLTKSTSNEGKDLPRAEKQTSSLNLFNGRL
jgi:hypothetical protein